MFDRRLALFLCLLVATGLTAPLHAQPYDHTVRDTVSLTPGSVSIENEEGSITVSTWERDAVAYEARIVSEQSKEYVEETTIEVDKFNQTLSIGTNVENLDPQWSFGPEIYGYGVSTPDVHYTLTIPRTAELSIDDHESDIDIAGLNAALEVETHDGQVQVADQRGPIQIDAHDGPVSVSDVRGDLKLDAHEGTATIDGLRGALQLNTHEGRAEVGIDSLAAVDVDTHEGEVTLTVPRDAGFDLSTEFEQEAAFTSDFALDAIRDEEGNYHGAVQGGGPLVHLRSHEGMVTLRPR